jgi:hypothetical protein
MQWQQMHYPRRGLPENEAARARLVTLDGIVGTALDACFCRGSGAEAPDGATFATLARCRDELDPTAFSSDASRYFGRLQQVIALVLDDLDAGPSITRTTGLDPAATKSSP